MKRIWLLTLLWLVACGGTAAPEPTPPPAPLPTQAVAETAVPPTAEPIPPTAAPSKTDVPTGFWVPFSMGTFGNPVPILRAGEMTYEPDPIPMGIQIFFDYDPIGGQIAYASLFWQGVGENGTAAVTNLMVYDYTLENAVQWLADGVGRAAWSPVAAEDGRVPLVVALHNGRTYDLALVMGPDEVEIWVEDIDPYLAWSPDGQQMAFVRDGTLLTVPLPSVGGGEQAWASDVYLAEGWVGDAPVWDLANNLLIYADKPAQAGLAPFVVVALDTGAVIRPIMPAGEVAPRPTKLLWAAGLGQLVAQEEGITGQTVRVYQLSADWQTVESSYTAPNTVLLGWYTAEESLWVMDEFTGELGIRPLTE